MDSEKTINKDYILFCSILFYSILFYSILFLYPGVRKASLKNLIKNDLMINKINKYVFEKIMELSPFHPNQSQEWVGRGMEGGRGVPLGTYPTHMCQFTRI
jgi:hypothetical protein